MADSDSSLSSPPATDDEMPVEIPPPKATKKPAPQKKKSKKNSTILSFFNPEPASPPRKKRPASPPHEYAPEDNPDIAFIVMFRSRFSAAFPSHPKCPHVGPQDIERGVADPLPSPQIESLLCALLGLVLNRKKPVEKGHYGRALEEAIQTQKSQWPRAWNHVNPLSGGRSFNTMEATERITLLKTLILWSLNQSESVRTSLTESYKSRTIKDRLDTNIPVSVQPWGRDGDKRRYWLIEGQDDTAFRIYRESNPALKTVTWWSVAGSIEELRTLAEKLENEDGTKEARALSERMLNAIPRFEATEAKRKRREYRLNRVAAFARPEPGFSLYEGRTRGKRMKYTFSDEEDVDSDSVDVRRSARQSGRDTPAAPSGPTVTASGRHVRNRVTGMYGEVLHSGQTTDRASPATGEYLRSDGSEEPGHPARSRASRGNRAENSEPKFRKHIDGYNEVDSMDEDDATSWDGGDEDEDDAADQMQLDDDDEDEGDESSDNDGEPDQLIVTLRYGKGAVVPSTSTSSAPPVQDTIAVATEGASQQNTYSAGAPLSGAGAPRDPQPAQTQAAAVFPPAHQPVAPPTTNGVQTQSAQQSATASSQDSSTLPTAPVPVGAPTPPYSASESAPKAQEQPEFIAHGSENHSPQSLKVGVETSTA